MVVILGSYVLVEKLGVEPVHFLVSSVILR